jgi:hypothetical protein
LTRQTDPQFAQYQKRRNEAMWLPKIRSFPVLIAGLVMVAIATGWALLLRPTPADAVGVFLDASHSVGLEYRNRYIPVVTSMLVQLVGKHLRIVRFGGVWQEIFQGSPRREDINALREFLLKTDIFPPHVVGSPISSATLEGIRWLSQQRGRRRVLLVFTDGEEQEEQITQSQRVPRIGENLTVIFCFPRTPNPVSAEVARLTGAHVVVARAPEEVKQVIQNLVLGTASFAWKVIAAILFAAGLVVSLFALTVERPPVSESEEKQGTSDELPLTPLEVELSARVIGQPSLVAFRKLRPGDRFVIAREGVPFANLTLPLHLLGEFFDFGITIQAEGGLRFCLQNFGKVPCIINDNVPLRPGESRQVEGRGFELEVFPVDIRLIVEAQPVVSKQISAQTEVI